VSSAEKYSGYLDHVQAYLGPVAEVEPPVVDGRNRGYALLFCRTPDGDLVSVVTNGLRFQSITTIMPQELVCTMRADQRRAAHLLIALTAELVMRMRQGLSLNQVVPSPHPLVPNTAITGVVADTHPYADDDFDVLLDASGTAELQIITLLPATAGEIAFAQQHGIDALYERWETQETDLLDVYRSSAA
jgi:Suppressor of fused protein (SUFU)